MAAESTVEVTQETSRLRHGASPNGDQATSGGAIAPGLDDSVKDLHWRLASIIETATDFAAIATPSGEVLYVNPAGLAMTGYDSCEGIAIPDLQPDIPAEALEEAVERGYWSGEGVFVRKDGSEVVTSQVISAVKDDDGNLLHFTTIARDLTEQKEAEIQMAAQAEVLSDISTPVIDVWDGMIMLPLIGAVDTMRAQQMVERLLEGIVRTRARVAILDVTGVPTVDTSVARHLVQTVEAAEMLGADVVLTGFSPEIAQTLTQLNVGFGSLRTRGSLRDGIAEAFGLLGRRVVAAGNSAASSRS